MVETDFTFVFFFFFPQQRTDVRLSEMLEVSLEFWFGNKVWKFGDPDTIKWKNYGGRYSDVHFFPNCFKV